MKRLDERVDAAIARASTKYFDSLKFVGPTGAELSVKAVKRVLASEEYSTIGASATARRFEFVVSRKTFDAIVDRLTGKSSTTLAEALASFRKSKLIERRANRETTYQLDGTTPFLDNSPDGSSIRLYAYESR